MNFDRYSRPIAMSDPGRHAALFDGLLRDAGALAESVQGLLIISTLPLPMGRRSAATSKLSRMFALSRRFWVTS
jgi:hypothetical protein